MDPLTYFPPELALKVVLQSPLSAVAALEATSKPWRAFLAAHEELVFAHLAGEDVSVDEACKRHEFAARCWEDMKGWREYCRRQTLLAHNWRSEKPQTTEHTVKTGRNLTWRFKIDLEHRLVITTHTHGGLRVTDLDTDELLWSIPEVEIRPHAHLEHDKGVMVFDRYGNELEVWKRADLDDPNAPRGQFKFIAILPHPVMTRGYHLADNILAVVTSTGAIFYWDLSSTPVLLRTLSHEPGPTGYLDKTPTALVLCTEPQIRICDPHTGVLQGVFPPPRPLPTANVFSIDPPPSIGDEFLPNEYAVALALQPLRVKRGGRSPSSEDDEEMVPIEQDEWSACHVDGPWLVAISKGGRVLVCSDWEGVLEDLARADETCAIIEVESDGNDLDHGGWLSVRHGRAVFEVVDHVYVLPLPEPGTLPSTSPFASPVLATVSGAMPVSCLWLSEDAVFMTFARMSVTLHPSNLMPAISADKHVRWISLAPEDQETGGGSGAGGDNEPPARLLQNPIWQLSGLAGKMETQESRTWHSLTASRTQLDLRDDLLSPLTPVHLNSHSKKKNTQHTMACSCENAAGKDTTGRLPNQCECNPCAKGCGCKCDQAAGCNHNSQDKANNACQHGPTCQGQP